MHTRHQHLFKTGLQSVRPTQITVGYAEVEQNRVPQAAHSPGWSGDESAAPALRT